MNEIKRVHLGRQQFTIAIEAYRALREYLEAIEAQPGVQSEVSKEVEMRMAELLTERGVSGEKVVLQEDVDYLKEQLGEPRDFKDDEAESAEESDSKSDKSETKGPKRLYRDTQDGMIAGVASGLAAYTKIDVIIIRVIFVGLIFASGAGVVAYLLLWILTPEAKTTSERLQMRGEAVNLDSLKAVIDRADIPGASERASHAAGSMARNTAKIMARIMTIVGGTIFTVIGTGIFIAAIATSLHILLNEGKLANDLLFPVGVRETWFMAIAFASAGIIGILFTIAGLSIFSRRPRIAGWITGALAAAAVLLITTGAVLAADIYPDVQKRIAALRVTETRELGSFNKLALYGKDTTYLFKSDTKSYVELTYFGKGGTTVLPTKIENNTLTIDTSDFAKQPACTFVCIYNDRSLVVTIHGPTIDSAILDGIENSLRFPEQLQQTDIAINVARNEGNYVYLSHMVPERVSITSRNEDATHQLVVQGIKPNAAAEQSISIYSHDGVSIMGTTPLAQLAITTDHGCDEYEASATLSVAPAAIMINDMTSTADELHKRRTDNPSIYNCVSVLGSNHLQGM